MTTDIIEVIDNGDDIRVVSVAYDEIKPKFDEVVYINSGGDDGDSAYDIALANGFIGTEQEWLDSLQGGGTPTYTNAIPISSSLGGIDVGDTFTDVPISDVLDQLLYPYIAPSISLSASPSNSLREIGNDIASIVFTATPSAGTNAITAITFKRGGVTQQTTVSDATWTETVPVNSVNTTFAVEATDASGKSGDPDAATRTFSFVYPFYWGVDANGLSGASIRTNFGATIQSQGTKTISFAPSNQAYYFAYPVSYGLLSKIEDWNAFDITTSFTQSVISITGLDGSAQNYNVYEWTDALPTHTANNLKFYF